jgi:uncharacterized iron-regulated membrane protein
MSRGALRRWAFVHKWTSLVCTAFLLLFCLTGLPLIFKDELRDLLSEQPAHAVLPADTPRIDLDTVVAGARQRHPGHVAWVVFVNDDEPEVTVSLLPSPSASPAQARRLIFDARTGVLLREIEPEATRQPDFFDVMLTLHRDLFSGLPGQLFLAAIGVMFVASLISGVVLYGPFMRKLIFGTVRRRGSARLRWLDLHNLLGIVTVAWALVVGATGIMNELSKPLFQIFQRTDMLAVLQAWRGQAEPAAHELAPIQGAFALVERALPGRVPITIVFPNDRIGSPHHYLIWTKGRSPLTGRLFTPALVDARTGSLTTVLALPWYLRALQVSRPLHFGDYGGLPLKLIWALLDVVTIAVLASGLYLWFARRRSPAEARLAELEATR